MYPTRHLAIARASAHLMTELFRQLLRLPPDIRLVSIYPDWQTDNWILALEGDSLPECAEGAVPESVGLTYYTTLKGEEGEEPRYVVTAIEINTDRGQFVSRMVVEE